MRILHIAPFNTAGVPMTLVKAERTLGHDSRLITLAPHPYGYPEDICLDLPFITTPGISHARNVTTRQAESRSGRGTVFSEPGLLKSSFFKLRDLVWSVFMVKNRLPAGFELEDFDLYQLDGGISLFRSGEPVISYANKGKPVISMYYGSDLRARGIQKNIHEISRCNFTVEYDHIDICPGIFHVPFPFDFSVIPESVNVQNDSVKIGHAPSNRAMKGTDIILKTLDSLKSDHDFELVLIENLPYNDALKLKRSCSLFIDQISNIGYGINSIESLAMGIPTFSSLTEHFRERNPYQPIVNITEDNLKSELAPFLNSAELRKKKGEQSKKWVLDFHDAVSVVKRIHNTAAEHIDSIRELISR